MVKIHRAYGLIFHYFYSHEIKTFVGQEITILWQDIKNTLEIFSLEIFKFISYLSVFFTLLNMFMWWLLKFENTFKQMVKILSWNYSLILNLFTALKYIPLRLSYLE